MKNILSAFAIIMLTMSFGCQKVGYKKSHNTNNGTACTSEQYYLVSSLDTLHRGSLPDTLIDADSVQVVYNVVADMTSSLSQGSRIDSVYYTGIIADSKGIKDSIIEIAVGQQPSYANWETGVIISGLAFDKFNSRQLHLKVKFTLFSSNAIGRAELQVTFIHNGSIGKPSYDNWNDECKKR